MTARKTLRQREKELQALMASDAGRAVLEELASHYHEAATQVSLRGKSVISFILVHERVHGLILD